MKYKRISERLEYPFARHFAERWVSYCLDNNINQSRLLKTIDRRRDFVSKIKTGNYATTLNLYTIQLLANLIGLSVVDICNYIPKEQTVTSPASQPCDIPATSQPTK